ncbi:MAG: DNA-directed RNA polymerase subunit alpha [Deltaproteobacteria bacterium]|nr:DNA-directed RNA polymerase subunit alpha [Deltaproteobacteria bacterium]
MQRNWFDLIKPKGVKIDAETHSSYYGEFVCQPLERGFGTTLGNSLRRVLLSSIMGAAIVSVKIEGVLHEFDTVKGVREDMTDIALNLKGVRFKLHTKEAKKLVVEMSGKGAVAANKINIDPQVVVLNPEHHIMTLTGEQKVKMEVVVSPGRGYLPARMERDSGQPEGTINIDALFSPVKQVSYTVTHARVGQITDYDRLEMRIWTDGALRPEDALAFAAKIIKEQMDIFINFDEDLAFEEGPGGDEDDEAFEVPENLEELLLRKIEDFEFKPRPMNCFKKSGIDYVGQLVQIPESQMLRMKNFGKKSLDEVNEVLHSIGLRFGMKVNFVPPSEEKE